MYGNVTRKIITNSLEAWSLTGVAKRLSFAIDNMNLPIANLVVDTPGGGNVNVFRHGNMEIWNLKSGPVGDTMFFLNASASDIYMLSVFGYQGKYRAMIDKTIHPTLVSLRDIYYLAPPYVYVLNSAGESPNVIYKVSAYTLETNQFIASVVVECTGFFADLIATPDGFVVMSMESYVSGYEWWYHDGEWTMEPSKPTSSWNNYLTRYNLVKRSFQKGVEVTVSDDLKTLYPLPGVGGTAWYANGAREFVTNNGGNRFAIGVTGPLLVGPSSGGAETWWPAAIQPPQQKWPVFYVYDVKTLELVEALSGQECADLQSLQNFDGLYQEIGSEDTLADVLWDAHIYADDSFEVYQYSLATGVRTVVFSVAADEGDLYDAYYRKFFLDKEGLFIPYEIADDERQLLRLKFDDAAGAVRDEAGDITLMEYEKRGTPVDFDCFSYTIAKNHQQAPAQPYLWA